MKIRHLRTIAASIALAATQALAVPALPGQWKSITLIDGETVTVQLMGDEHRRYWQSSDGRIFKLQGKDYVELSAASLSRNSGSVGGPANIRRARRERARRARALYQGEKRGLVILVEFADKKFKATHNASHYANVCNTPGFTSSDGYVGSVRDYFLAQSGGQFGLTFDVIGPVSLPNGYSYYGKNVHNDDYDTDEDARAGQMVAEACMAADSQVDFSRYDWDGDGYADQVMVIFAGKGEHDGGGDDTIWPHEYELLWSDYGKVLSLDGVKINTYACSCELTGTNHVDGIGTICHEFSHCLGLPDYYDTSYSGNYGLGSWSLMSSGSYNGGGFCPAGYTSFEKLTCGWADPIELSQDTLITGMAPQSEGGTAYKLTNQAHPDEFYLLENRQKTGWDASLPGQGLLILHVDYDEEVWEYNEPNTTEDALSGNDHQRCTIFHADNADTRESGDPYPYQKRDSLTRYSLPRATLYHPNTDGSLLMDRSVLAIAQDESGTISFRIRQEPPISMEQRDDQVMFYESFDICNGKGGNDGLWSGNIAQKTLVCDNVGWDYNKGYGADRCAKFGTIAFPGVATTPPFSITGPCVVTFYAAPWSGDAVGLQLSVSGSAKLETTYFELDEDQWTHITTSLTGQGKVQLTFQGDRRIFLDEVKVTSGSPAAIRDIRAATSAVASLRIYNLKGQYMGTDPQLLPKGIYVRGGKKMFRSGK